VSICVADLKIGCFYCARVHSIGSVEIKISGENIKRVASSVQSGAVLKKYI